MKRNEAEYRRMRQWEQKRRKRLRRRRNRRILARLFASLVLIGSAFILIHAILDKQVEIRNWNSNQVLQKQVPKSNPKTDPILLDWNLTLVNEKNSLPEGFIVETENLENGMAFDKRAIPALKQLLADGNSQGLQLMVCSAYRSIERQKEIFQKEIEESMAEGLRYEEAYEVAKTAVAIPGTSEHNLGLAADICAVDHQVLDEAFADTEEGKWLVSNAEKYGFILRYPKEKQEITGIIYEPWHFRYVGIEAAEEINGLDMCLEEYVEYLMQEE